MNSNPPVQPRLRYAVVFHDQPDRIPHLPRQRDDLCKVLLLSSGSASYTAGRKQYSVQAGDVLICRPETHCALLPDPDGICYTALNFDILSPSDAVHIPSEDVFHCGGQLPELLSLAEMLLAAGSQPAVQSHLLSALLLQICTGIIMPPDRVIPQESPACAMSRFIDAHYTEDIFLSDIAGAAHITASHAIHVFKPIFGVSPVQYLNSRRIGQAQHLLLTTDLSASQIASMAGISNINYFYTVFKKLVGQSPVSYRAYLRDKATRFTD